jgi:SAM-dependent methyltransferase
VRGGPALVFCASGAVLVLEILGVRLLAPYVGATLETYTAIIGVVLAGIAGGAAAGGRAADEVDPRRLVPGLLVAGGLLAIATIPLVRLLGVATEGGGAAAALVIALFAFLAPAAVLSAVTPAVAKAALHDLGHTGEVVGRLSAWATAGALAGTFATGFVLVPLVPTRATIYAIGGALVVAGLVLGARSRAPTVVSGAVVLALAGVALGSRCDTESIYFCARVVADDDPPSGRVLLLDDLRHSYVDLADPTHLEFAYARWIGDVIDRRRPRDAVWIGGGGFTLPRYLAATVPGARSLVLEVDRQLVALDRERLGLRTSDALRVRIGDARQTLRDVRDDSADLVVGDAFGGLAVPWHLATEEFLRDVRRVLRPDGIYALNLIDLGPLRFARAEAATLLRVFGDVALVDDDEPGGNLVFFASDVPLDADRIGFGRRGEVRDRAEVAAFARDAQVLTDDHAPADQLLTPQR